MQQQLRPERSGRMIFIANDQLHRSFSIPYIYICPLITAAITQISTGSIDKIVSLTQNICCMTTRLNRMTGAVQWYRIGGKASDVLPVEMANFGVVADVPQLINRLHNGLDRHIGTST
ncbi:hypothetical protein [Sulfuriferula multivorans]|uniref:hypothetical protein n=1 Tax=Sulfuriferula multivorans TaxID=1559896 RepID=UPI001671CC79|nr:hypothetical protein [Sulfuriferula multivorans]